MNKDRMKKILRWIGRSLMILIIAIVVLWLILALKPLAPLNYTKKTECGGTIEAKYLSTGEYETSVLKNPADEPMKKFTVYYPSELKDSDRVYPAVIMVNGTGVPASKYKSVLKHLASWGFVVIGNEDPGSGNGHSTDKTLMYLLAENENIESIFYHKIDIDNIGLEGHSQGGAGVFSAVTINEHGYAYKTAVALSPTQEETSIAMGWPYELDKIGIPVMMLAGTQGDFETQLVLPIEEMKTMFNRISSVKVMARKIGMEHGQMLYSADGYVTAWFMWQLQNDSEAAKAFIGDNPELMDNPLYQDQAIMININR